MPVPLLWWRASIDASMVASSIVVDVLEGAPSDLGSAHVVAHRWPAPGVQISIATHVELQPFAARLLSRSFAVADIR